MSYCLDTNIIVDIFRGDSSLKEKVEGFEDSQEFFLTPITVSELYKGANLSNNVEESIEIVDSFVNNCNILDFDIESCKEFGNLYGKLLKKGSLIPEFDLMIASIVKVKDLVLVSRDKKHFSNLGIKVEIW